MAQDDQRLDIETQEVEEQPDQEQPQEEKDPKKKKKEKETPETSLYMWVRELSWCLVLVLLIFMFGVRIITVDGDSMFPTMRDQDQVLLLSSTLYTQPENGDIVVAYIPKMDKPLIKRVIATEGQTIDIDFENHQVWVDGELLDEPYISAPTANPESGLTYPQTVPEGCIFIMGDNRNNSRDSRDADVGMVDTRCILGKVLVRVAPRERAGKIQ